jgi:hypothetical protein
VLSSIPFPYRLTALFAIAAAAAWLDWRHHRPHATKWKEYFFLVTVSLLGAIVGMANDTVTSHLSPEYFIYGKGIAPGPNFFKGVLELAFQAGLVAAFVGGAAYLFANNPKVCQPSLSYPQLYAWVKWPILCALLFATVLGVGSQWFVGPQIDSEMTKVFGEAKTIWFWRVWYIHIGLYSGLTIGVGWGIFGIRRDRQKLAYLP